MSAHLPRTGHPILPACMARQRRFFGNPDEPATDFPRMYYAISSILTFWEPFSDRGGRGDVVRS